jgi:hypothetical protein
MCGGRNTYLLPSPTSPTLVQLPHSPCTPAVPSLLDTSFICPRALSLGHLPMGLQGAPVTPQHAWGTPPTPASTAPGLHPPFAAHLLPTRPRDSQQLNRGPSATLLSNQPGGSTPVSGTAGSSTVSSTAMGSWRQGSSGAALAEGMVLRRTMW